MLIFGTAIFLILVLTDFSETSTTGAKSTTSGLERTEFTTETITTITEEPAANTSEPSGTFNDCSSARYIFHQKHCFDKCCNTLFVFLIVYELVSTNEIDDLLPNFAKRIGNIMPWDIGYFPNATEDSRFPSMCRKIVAPSLWPFLIIRVL